MPKTEIFNRQIVIDQATEVFHRKGYHATSMQDLVDATGLNRSSIYNSFENKQSLFLLCLKNYSGRYTRANVQSTLSNASTIKVIESIFNLYIQEICNDKDGKGCLIVNCKSEMANKDKAINNFLIAHQNDTLAFLEDVVILGQAKDDINTSRSAKDYALYLFSSLQGLRMTGILISDRAKLQTIVQNILSTLM
ncbi:TetR/AcrR family transcriptional regulator [Winogradskyella maritima]|uniref:TetR/AcrR family transcriptional regulator n=1 Tax=Winogradskyella maritima TaxID=1517766 RepID=A0ABV8AJ24_9FLAO|nr:TetR/AcrR family transcriptional regulator [Winogradskyella maritima]